MVKGGRIRVKFVELGGGKVEFFNGITRRVIGARAALNKRAKLADAGWMYSDVDPLA